MTSYHAPKQSRALRHTSMNQYIVQLKLFIRIAQQCIALQRLILCIARQQPCQQEHASAHLARCSHPVPEDLGVQPRKEHQAYDPVCVAQGAAPQQQVGHV